MWWPLQMHASPSCMSMHIINEMKVQGSRDSDSTGQKLGRSSELTQIDPKLCCPNWLLHIQLVSISPLESCLSSRSHKMKAHLPCMISTKPDGTTLMQSSQRRRT